MVVYSREEVRNIFEATVKTELEGISLTREAWFDIEDELSKDFDFLVYNTNLDMLNEERDRIDELTVYEMYSELHKRNIYTIDENLSKCSMYASTGNTYTIPELITINSRL